MILEEVTQSVLAIAATAMILTLFLRMVAVALKAVADGNPEKDSRRGWCVSVLACYREGGCAYELCHLWEKRQAAGFMYVPDGPAVFPAVSAGSCCGRLSDGKIRIETVPVLWRPCQNPEAQGRQVLRGLLQLRGQRWCCLGERLAQYTLCCTGTGCKALECPKGGRF